MDDYDSLLSVIEQHGQAEAFERALLQVSAGADNKGKTYCDTICYVDPASGFIIRDYTTPVRNTLAVCLKEWRKACGEQYSVPDENVMSLMAMKLTVDMPDLVTSSEIPIIAEEWRFVMSSNAMLPVASNDELVTEWMKRRRLEKAVKDSHFQITTGSRKIRTRSIVERLNKNMQLADLSGSNTNAKLLSIDDILSKDKNNDTATTFYSTGVPILDRMLGGGYVRGYSYLHVTLSGGGKTVFATQLCSNLSLRQDLPCLWISTEEPANEVYFRLISNFCGIPHEDIRKNLPTDSLIMSPPVKIKYDMVVNKLRSLIRVKRWENEDYDLKLDLTEEIKAFESSMGKQPAYVIFDWLSASSTELGANNGVRNALKAKSYEMDQVAKKNNLSLMFFMQASEQYRNERFINQSHVDECKTCGFKTPAVIGWSALPNKGDGTQLASNGTHLDAQFMSVGKSRFGPGGWFGFKRNYAVQRMEFPR